MAIVINSNPGAYYSVHGDLIFVVYEVTKANDPVTYPDYKYVADIYIGVTLVARIKKVPQPDNKRGVFNVADIIRSYLLASFNPTANELQSQQLGLTEFYINAKVKFGEEYDFTLYTNLTVDDERFYFNHYNGRLIGQNTILAPYLDKAATIRPYKTAVSSGDNFTFIPYFPSSTDPFDVVFTRYTTKNPGPSVNIQWGYFATDPYDTVDSQTMQFGLDYASGTNSLNLNYSSLGNLQYLVLKEPSSQPVKTTWYNTVLNYGTIPDSVFRAPVVIGDIRYYVSRNPVVLDSGNYAILYSNGNPDSGSPVVGDSFTQTVTPSSDFTGNGATFNYTLSEQASPFIDGNFQIKQNGVILDTMNVSGSGSKTMNAGDSYSLIGFCEMNASGNPKIRMTISRDSDVIYDSQIVADNTANMAKSGIAQPGAIYTINVTTLNTTDTVTPIDTADTDPIVTLPALQVLNVSPGLVNVLNPGFIDDSVLYYTVQIGATSVFMFDLVCEVRYEVYRVHFLNKFGGFETRNFTKVSRNKIDINKSSFTKLPYTIDNSGNVSYYNTNNVYNETTSVYASLYSEGLTLNTDILTDDEYMWLGDLIKSPMVYVEMDGYFVSANITATNYEFKKQVNDKLTNLTIDIKFGDQFNAQFR